MSIVCSTDLDVMTIEWITDNTTVDNSSSQSLTLLLDPVSADHHNTQYTCRVTSPYGTQEETINVTVQSKFLILWHLYRASKHIDSEIEWIIIIQSTVPQSWATVQISTPADDSAVVGREFVMNCTVTAVRGLTVVPSVLWTGPDGNLTDAENTTAGPAQTLGLVTNRSLALHYLQSPEGGQYYCTAAIRVPGFEIPPQISAYAQLNVISMLNEIELMHWFARWFICLWYWFPAIIGQALLQLKFGPLQHCVNWINPHDVSILCARTCMSSHWKRKHNYAYTCT